MHLAAPRQHPLLQLQQVAIEVLDRRPANLARRVAERFPVGPLGAGLEPAVGESVAGPLEHPLERWLRERGGGGWLESLGPRLHWQPVSAAREMTWA
jgi:hypothetical protein